MLLKIVPVGTYFWPVVQPSGVAHEAFYYILLKN